MTTFGAYDAGLPCKNTSCKSHGSPHPNCRCYGDMAKGGNVEPFCSSNRSHKSDCEYFADGGEAANQPPMQVYIGNWGDDAKPVENNDQKKADVWGNDAQGIWGDDAKNADNIPKADVWGKDAQEDPNNPQKQPESKYGSTGQQALTGAESFAKGVLGPIATGAEIGLSKLGVPGLSAEDQARREEENPTMSGAGQVAGTVASFAVPEIKALGVLTTMGRAAKLEKLAEGVKYGAKFIQGAISNGLIAAEDEASKIALGQGDPEHASAYRMIHVLAASGLGGLLNVVGGPLANKAKQKLEALADSKVGERALYFMRGMAEQSQPGMRSIAKDAPDALYQAEMGIPKVVKQSYETGKKLARYYGAGTTIGGLGITGYEARKGFEEDGVNGALKGVGKGLLLGFGAKYAAPYAGAAVLKILSKGYTNNILKNVDRVNEAVYGSKMTNKIVDGLFDNAPSITEKVGNEVEKQRERDALDKIIDDNTVEKQAKETSEQNGGNFAEGGEVSIAPDNSFADIYPEQNMVMSAAKGRVAEYLRSQRPNKYPQKLPFDANPDVSAQKKSYHKALDIASNPLSVIENIKKGTLTTDHLKHFNQLYPEINSVLQKKISEKIVHAQLNGKVPSRKIRQGLSMFMGSALSSEFNPENIQAAQAVFSKQDQQSQPQDQKPVQKGSPSKLSKSDQSFLTGGQALQRRSQKV